MRPTSVAPEPSSPIGDPPAGDPPIGAPFTGDPPVDPLEGLLPPDDRPSRGAVAPARPDPVLIGDRLRAEPRSGIVELWHRLRTDPRASWVLLLVGAVAAGFVWYRMGVAEAPTRTASAPAAASSTDAARGSSSGADGDAVKAATPATARSLPPVVVHVAGAVVRPGVVQLAAGSRVVDALAAAGGATLDADVNRLNLAAKLIDGQRIAVPTFGEVAGPAPVDAGGDAPAGGSGASTGTPTAENPLDLNTATATDLEALPGIGPSLAQAIIAERTKRGGFESVNDLRSVRGIGDGRFADLKDFVHV